MNDYLSHSLHRHFRKLSMTGYAPDAELSRLLGVVIITDFVSKDYRGFLTPCDMRVIERALYNITGGCAQPYPKVNRRPIMNKLRLGDISEMAGRLELLTGTVEAYTANAKAKQKQQDGRLDKLEGFHNIESPEYDEDDEKEYGAGREPRDRGHVETKGCHEPVCKDGRGRLVAAPLPPPPPVPIHDCDCVKLSWR